MSGAFTGMSVLITGGASGIGRATALIVVSQGARVASLDLVSSGEAEENIFEVVGDVSSASSTARAVDRRPNTWAASMSWSTTPASEHRGPSRRMTAGIGVGGQRDGHGPHHQSSTAVATPILCAAS